MRESLIQLQTRLAALTETSTQLAKNLQQAAHLLDEQGLPPEEALPETILDFRCEFAEVQQAVQELIASAFANQNGLSDVQASGRPAFEQNSLSSLARGLAWVEGQCARQERLQAMLPLLDKVLALQHSGQTEFAPLLECQALAARFRSRLFNGDAGLMEPDTEQTTRAFDALMQLIEGKDEELADHWDSLQEIVSQAFSRPLAIAAARGRIATRLPVNLPTLELEPGPPIAEDLPQPTEELPTSPVSEELPIGEDREDSEIPVDEHVPVAAVEFADAADQSVELSSPPVPAEPVVPEELWEQNKIILAETISLDANLADEASPFSRPVIGEVAPLLLPDLSETVADAVSARMVPPPVSKSEVIGPEHILYRFLQTDTAARIAQEIQQRGSATCPAELRDLSWRLLYEDRVGLAWHLLGALEKLPDARLPQLPGWLLHALALSRHVSSDHGALAGQLKADYDNFDPESFHTASEEWNHALKLLLVAASLRPALLAPNSNASAFLHLMHFGERLGNLFNYCAAIAQYGDQRQTLDLQSLRAVKDPETWQAEQNALQEELRQWYALAPNFDMINGRARAIWRHWLKPEGLLHSLLAPVRENKVADVNKVKEQLRQLADDNQIEWLVLQTDRQLHGRIGAKLVSRPLGRLCRSTHEAAGFARQWVVLQETRPSDQRDFLQAQAEQLRRELRQFQGAVEQELSEFEQRWQSSGILHCALAVCRRAIEDIRQLFDPSVSLPTGEPESKELLHAELLCVPSVPLSEQWEPLVAPEQLLESIVALLVAPLNWSAAFDARLELRDHETAQYLLNYLARTPQEQPHLDLEALNAKRERHLIECRNALKSDVAETRRLLESAVAFGLLREQERVAYAAQLESIELAQQQALRFLDHHEKLQTLRDRIATHRQAEIENISQQLAQALNDPSKPFYAFVQNAAGRIRGVLERGDVLTANEYLHLALNRSELPAVATQAANFEQFFPQTFREIVGFLDPADGTPTPLIDRLANDLRAYADGQRQHYRLGPVSLKGVTGPQAKQAAELLEAWFTAKRTQRLDSEQARRLLNYLGFNVTQPPQTRAGRRLWFEFEAEPLADRTRCPVASYGSQANGKYRVLCVWDRPTEEDLLADVGETVMAAPVFVFYFGRLVGSVPEVRRKALARVCLERRRSFVVLDDVLLFYLCGERDMRLRGWFEGALPFTFCEPYTTTAGLVPTEMFYGRRRERDTIIDPFGSCFIYGGRQLGKTALLRDVERAFHQPAVGRLALWLDLKANGIGYDRGVDDFWVMLVTELKRLGVAPEKTAPNISVEKLLDHIYDWLQADVGRRLLLLLDEADRFLEIDGQPPHKSGEQKGEFVRAARLKGLMDRTNRRFKVVFAGLHNVQRTTRLENHPLAHYGEPICIGPLLNDGEVREARALVERPFGLLGFRFESPDLVTRILSQTNYYPSLIQLYCNHLLRHMHKITPDDKSGPPYLITSQHLEEAYQNTELRKAIRERLNLTLNLDPRYRVIAYTIAYETHPADHQLHRMRDDDSLTVAEIQREVLRWWEEGFASVAAEEAFQVLLDEMIGLGILRAAEGNRYALRSPNVALLIGTLEEIEAELLACSKFEPLPPYEALTFRAAFGVRTARRSPLTAQQESGLRVRQHGISLLFGSEMAGLHELPEALNAAFGSECFIYQQTLPNRQAFTRQLENLRQREQSVETTLLLLSHTCPWNEQWVLEALESVQRLVHKNSFVRVAFIADPATAWQWVTRVRTLDEQLRAVPRVSLQPWHDAALHYWLDDCGFPSKQTQRQQITAVTGNWSFLLHRFYESAHHNPHHWERHLQKLEEELRQPQQAAQMLARFGLGPSENYAVLHTLAVYNEPASAAELRTLDDQLTLDVVQRSLRWAELLSLVTPASDERWRLNAVVAALLKTCGES